MLNKQKIFLQIAQYFDLPLNENLQRYVLAYKLQYGLDYCFVNDFSFELEEDGEIGLFKEYRKSLINKGRKIELIL